MKKHVHLIISDLLLPEQHHQTLCSELTLPTLRNILARASQQALPLLPPEQVLCQLFGLKHSPIAALGARQELSPELAPQISLRADPVYLRLQRDKLMLEPIAQLNTEETQALVTTLNSHFVEQGLFFSAPHPQRWYLQLTHKRDIQSVLWSQAIGRNVNTLLPAGAEALWWHQLLNEIQMLLFNHPVNQQREELGQVPVNSLWLWGEGELTALDSPYQYVSADQLLPQWLAQTAACGFEAWAPRWQAKLDQSQLLVFSALSETLLQGDLSAWQQQLFALEQNYLAPLWQAVKQGQLASLEVELLGNHTRQRLRLTRWDCYCFWRKSADLP